MRTKLGIIANTISVSCCIFIVWQSISLAQKTSEENLKQPTKTIIGDLLDIDRDLYIVRGEQGEIQIEATHKTDITEEFGFGDRIKALVLMNNKALTIERAGPNDVNGVLENQLLHIKDQAAPSVEKEQSDLKPKSVSPQAKQPDSKTIIGDLLDIDRDLYIVRGEQGEIQIEATHKTDITEEFGFGDRIKALVLMNNKALTIERAGPNDVNGVFAHRSEPQATRATKGVETPGKKKSKKPSLSSGHGEPKPTINPKPIISKEKKSDTSIIEGQILMVDGDFYVLRGERGEIRIERTEKTKVTENLKFGDYIKATVGKNHKAVVIERMK